MARTSDLSQSMSRALHYLASKQADGAGCYDIGLNVATYESLVRRGLAAPHPVHWRHYVITEAGADLAKRLPQYSTSS